MQTTTSVQISCEVYKTISGKVTDALKKCGVKETNIQSGRTVVLSEKKGFMGLGAGTVLDEEPSELFTFNVPVESEDGVISAIVREAALNEPGRGSIISQRIDSTCAPAEVKPAGELFTLGESFARVTCIVQRGQGNPIARAALDMGFSVPNITFGRGTGLRDKLGLLRITIPADKEVLQLTVDSRDAGGIMNFLVEAGKLDQPGKGFIYVCPAQKGLVNTKIFRGTQRHAASIEQIISAIDDVRGNTEWRKRTTGGVSSADTRHYLSDLVNMTMICNEGRASELVTAAMNVGAGGATVSKLRHLRLDGGSSSVSRARESSDLIVSQSQVDIIEAAMAECGLYDEKTAGVIELKPVSKACTYLGASR